MAERAAAHRDAGWPRSERWAGYGLAAPAAALLLILVIGPVLAIFVIALTDWGFGLGHVHFVGLRHFASLSADPFFRRSLLNTAVYTIMVVPTTLVLGLGVALLIESGSRLRAFYRAVHLLPFLATLAAMALAWEALLHPTIGLVNQILQTFGLPGGNWLRDRSTVLPMLALIGVWQNLGFAMLLFLAGLKAIPQELYDAARIDGADGTWARLRTVTLPLLGPTMMFVVIVTAIRALEVFDTVRILTQGGPAGSSEVLLYTFYIESFRYLRMDYGAAITVVFLALVIVLTLLQARVMERRVHYL